MSVTLEISSDVVQSVRLAPGEVEHRLRLELALALYAQDLLPSGKACELAGLTRWQWEELLGQRQIARHYATTDLAEDVAHGQRGQ
jgi:predicted HTH domain antitoxin